MEKDEYKIYILAMMQLLLNEEKKLDLGTHKLESYIGFQTVNGGDMIKGDAALALGVRLKNKSTKKIEWGQIYNKILIPQHGVASQEDSQDLEKSFKKILSSSNEEKIEFILKSEGKIFKKAYLKSIIINPDIADFFENLQYQTYNGSTVKLGGKIPNEAKLAIDKAFVEVMEELKQQNTNSKTVNW